MAIPSLVFATKVLTSTGNIADADTCAVGGVTYRFKDTLAQANDVKRGASAVASLTSLYHAINGSGTSGTDYHASTTAQTYAVATAVALSGESDATLTVSAKDPGVLGNLVAIAETSTPLAWAGGATTLGSGAGTVDAFVTAIMAERQPNSDLIFLFKSVTVAVD